MTSAPEMTSPEEEEAPISVLSQPDVDAEDDTTKELETSDQKSQDDSNDVSNVDDDADDVSLENVDVVNRGMEESKVYENAKLMLMQTDEAGSGMPSIKVSGTLKLVPPKQHQKDDQRGGCLPSCLISIWGYLFD